MRQNLIARFVTVLFERKFKSKEQAIDKYNEDNWPLSTTQLYQANSIRHNSNHKPIVFTFHSKMMQLAVV